MRRSDASNSPFKLQKMGSSMKAFVIITNEVLRTVLHAVYTVLSEYTH